VPTMTNFSPWPGFTSAFDAIVSSGLSNKKVTYSLSSRAFALSISGLFSMIVPSSRCVLMRYVCRKPKGVAQLFFNTRGDFCSFPAHAVENDVATLSVRSYVFKTQRFKNPFYIRHRRDFSTADVNSTQQRNASHRFTHSSSCLAARSTRLTPFVQ
jgi:hypothetical protein